MQNAIVCKKTGQGIATKLGGGLCACPSSDECRLERPATSAERARPKSTISPPPWRYRERGEIYDAQRNRPIIYCAAWTQGSEAEANGALVAAAPDLQSALRDLVARIDLIMTSPSTRSSQLLIESSAELIAARAALARSESACEADRLGA